MCVVRFEHRAIWLAALKEWKSMMAEPWVYLDRVVSMDQEGVRWRLWVQGSVGIGASVWLFHECIGGGNCADTDVWDAAKDRALAVMSDVRSSLSEIGLAAVRAVLKDEVPRDG